jgi:sugar/nucleoside kinase (ribokinase family)
MDSELQQLAWAQARRADPDLPESPWAEGLTSTERRQAWLAMLAALTATEREIGTLTATAAERAAEHGADYPALGAAAGMTRQGARRRWPGLSRRGATAGFSRRVRQMEAARDKFLSDEPITIYSSAKL